MKIFAHRGDNANHLENTAAAFHSALQLGFQNLELDLMRIGDGTVVVFHDEDLDRLFARPGRVASLTLSEFRAVFPELLTFDEFYRLFKDSRAEINFEIKDDLATLEAVASRLKEFRCAVVSSEKHEIVDRAIRLGLEGAYLADQHDHIPHSMLGLRLHVSCHDRDFLERLPFLGRYRLYCYTVNDPGYARVLSDYTHVAGIFTDNPQMLSVLPRYPV
jgi:glycerophosphoryl diester phosphodiesterase